METLPRTAAAYPVLRHTHSSASGVRKDPTLFFPNTYFASFSSAAPFTLLTLRKSLIVAAKKDGNNQDKKRKQHSHSFLAREHESIGLFPEAVLLKEEKLQEDGRFLPDFADAEEEKLYESLNLELQSQVKVERMRHYEVVYLIHEKHAEELRSVNDKVQDFLREKKGKIWRFNDWGMRWLAYPIQKADYAHYILMNFEMEAKWLNDFERLLDKDERVIRHLVMKRDEAITEDCPPPPEFLTLCEESGRNDFDFDDDEEDDSEYDDEEEDESEYDDEGEDDYENDDEEEDEYGNEEDEEDDYEYDDEEEEEEDFDGETEDDVVVINIDDMDDGYEDRNSKSVGPVEKRKNRIPEEVGRK